MSREARTILVLGLISLVAVVALGGMARHYRRVLLGRQDVQARMESRVRTTSQPVTPRRVHSEMSVTAPLAGLEAFIRVRREMCSAIDAGTTSATALLEIRNRELARHHLSDEQYVEARRLYRLWRSGETGLERAQLQRLELRRAELEAVDLGRFEAMDP